MQVFAHIRLEKRGVERCAQELFGDGEKTISLRMTMHDEGVWDDDDFD